MRALGIDLGRRRIGLAISDPSGCIARPLSTLHVTTDAEALDRVVGEIDRLGAEDDGLAVVVVGLPFRLDGTPGDETARTAGFVRMLAGRVSVPIVTTDEWLTSREAESRLAIKERDWRRRKEKLDAAAAAVILQDYLDRQHRSAAADAEL